MRSRRRAATATSPKSAARRIGAEDPALDVELIVLADDAFKDLGLRNYRILLNSLGDKECRPVYRAKLQEFLRGLDLDEETRARIDINPAAGAGRQARRGPEAARRRPADGRQPLRRLQGLPRGGPHPAHRRRRRLRRRPQAGARPGLLHPHHLRVRARRPRARSRRSAAAAVTTGCPRSSAARPCPSVGWALGVDRTVLALEAEGVERLRRRALGVFAVPLGEDGRGHGSSSWSPRCAARGSPPTSPTATRASRPR